MNWKRMGFSSRKLVVIAPWRNCWCWRTFNKNGMFVFTPTNVDASKLEPSDEDRRSYLGCEILSVHEPFSRMLLDDCVNERWLWPVTNRRMDLSQHRCKPKHCQFEYLEKHKRVHEYFSDRQRTESFSWPENVDSTDIWGEIIAWIFGGHPTLHCSTHDLDLLLLQTQLF